MVIWCHFVYLYSYNVGKTMPGITTHDWEIVYCNPWEWFLHTTYMTLMVMTGDGANDIVLPTLTWA